MSAFPAPSTLLVGTAASRPDTSLPAGFALFEESSEEPEPKTTTATMPATSAAPAATGHRYLPAPRFGSCGGAGGPCVPEGGGADGCWVPEAGGWDGGADACGGPEAGAGAGGPAEPCSDAGAPRTCVGSAMISSGPLEATVHSGPGLAASLRSAWDFPSCSATALSTAAARSEALWYRASGSFAVARATTWSKAFTRSGRFKLGGGGGSVTCAHNLATSLSLGKATLPVSIS